MVVITYNIHDNLDDGSLKLRGAGYILRLCADEAFGFLKLQIKNAEVDNSVISDIRVTSI